MISRVAEHCFWLLRYMERAESMASLLRVNRSFLLDINVPELDQWYPVLVVSGEQERFRGRYSEASLHDGEVVQEYLTWDDTCLVSITASAFWARENARIIREIISLEMWESINGFWHWLKRGQGKRLYRRDRDAFYRHVRDSAAQFQGICHNTMLHEQPFDFMRLGMLLERAGQTARTMDVKYHLLGPTSDKAVETPVEAAQWMSLLRSCSARDLFYRRYHFSMRAVDVIGFLLKEELFPRSVYHCLTRAWNFLRRIDTATSGRGVRSKALLSALVESLAGKTTRDIIATGLHAELTRVIDATAEVCNAIHSDYFDPGFTEGWSPQQGA